MLMLWRSIKADFIKLKRTSIIYIHILIPIIGAYLFLTYYSISSWSTETKLAAYYHAMAIIFPLLIGIITGIITDQEEGAGGFQNMFTILKGKATSYFSKLFVLLLLSVFSIIMAILTFALVFKTIASFSRSPQMWGMANGIGSAARPVTDFVRSFAKNRILSEKTVNVISLILVLVVWFMV